MRRLLPTLTLALALGATGCGASAGAHPDTENDQAALDRESAETLFSRGKELAERGDPVRAEQYLLLAVQRGYDRGAVLPVLLPVCLGSLHLRTALDHAESYLLDHPDDDALRYLVATIHVGLGQKYEARNELERLLAHSADDADAHFLLGVLTMEFDAKKAREHLLRYLAVAPDGRRAGEAHSRLSELAMREPERAGTNVRPWLDVSRGRK